VPRTTGTLRVTFPSETVRAVMPRPASAEPLRQASRKTMPIRDASSGASTEAMLIIARLAASPRSSPLSSTSMASGVSMGSRKLSRFTATPWPA
jgi:hypothetical protein